MAEIAIYKVKKKPISIFFLYSAAITVLFGGIDLYLKESVLFKYEATISNILVGCFFASTLLGKKPIIQEFAEAQGRISKELSLDGQFYFKFITLIWSVYFWLKAAIYAWLASRVSIGEGFLIRTLIGSASFYALLAISIFGYKFFHRILKKLKLLPSQQLENRSFS